MKRVLVGLAALAFWCGGASAGPASSTTRGATLSFTIAPGISDSGLGPLGGGICLGSKRVTDPKADEGSDWSPDGSRIAFYRQTDTLTAHVFVAAADGSGLRDLTKGNSEFSWAPDWSPDGSRIVYVASDRTVERLVTVRPDGSDPQPIPGLEINPNDQLRGPRWSPDGSLIGYTLTDGIHVLRPDGSGGRVLLGNASGFNWSPDGSRIVFTRNGDLALASSDGSDVTVLTHTPNLIEGGGEWSPDGSKLTYVSVDETDPKLGNGPGNRMFIADSNGRNRRLLLGPRGVGAWSPNWRPAAPAVKTRPCVILGTRRANRILGTPKGDLIVAGLGNDIVRGRGGDDIIVGDVPFTSRPGRDRLYGGSGRDYIDASDGRRDLVDGGPGRDRAIWDRHDRVRSIERYG